MLETVQEFCDSRGLTLRIDRGAGVIRGIKILGLQSKNGRRYPAETLAAAAPLYEGAKVNINHPKGSPHAPRDYQDRLGQVRQITQQADGLYGDLHYNAKHPLAEQLLWDAEHAPENVGLSHNVEARVTRQQAETIVEEIVRVQSVDLVADPATTRGLFESAQGELHWDALTVAELQARRPDLCAALQETLTEQNGQLTAEVGRLQAIAARHERREVIERVAAALALPAPYGAQGAGSKVFSEAFLATLYAAADETAVRGLLEDRRQLLQEAVARGAKPAARDQWQVEPAASSDRQAFLSAIR